MIAPQINYTAADLVDVAADSEMNWVISLIEEIRSSRAQMGVPVGLKLPMLLAEADAPARAALANNEALILKLARVETITEGAVTKGAISIPAQGALFGLPLEGVIDVTAEKARLEKALGKIEKEIAPPTTMPKKTIISGSRILLRLSTVLSDLIH